MTVLYLLRRRGRDLARVRSEGRAVRKRMLVLVETMSLILPEDISTI
jgi:hypothetical protein